VERTVALALLLVAAGSRLAAQETETGRAWSGAASATQYLLPDDPDVLVGVVRADRGGLHLEGRWNYEAMHAGSLYGGWTFAFGSALAVEATPMLGVVAGTVVGVAPGVELSVEAGPVLFYTETEYVQDLRDRGDSFIYTWTELGVGLGEVASVGLTGQRLRITESPLGIDRGPYARLTAGQVSVTAYLFNIGTDSRFAVLSLAAEF
jgi:hypothetical protein